MQRLVRCPHKGSNRWKLRNYSNSITWGALFPQRLWLLSNAVFINHFSFSSHSILELSLTNENMTTFQTLSDIHTQDSHSEKMDTGTVNVEIQLLPEKPHMYFSHVQSLQLSSTLLSSYWTSSMELNILQIILYPQTVTLCILLCETNKEASYLLHTIL